MAKLTKISVTRGVSFQKGQYEPWYKIQCGIELELDENDNADEVKRKAWNTVDLEIEKQLQEIINE